MIKIENTKVFNIAGAVYSARNAMNSWDKSDSDLEKDILGENDLKLAKQLSKAGADHGKFLRMITVCMDITAPLYWTLQFDTYKVGTTTNACSKMHKLLAKPFEISDFSFDKLFGYKNEVKQFRPPMDEEMVANEIWVSWDNEYAVSNYGRVKHEFKTHYRIISGSLHQDGYIFATIKGKQIPVHRMVQICFTGGDKVDLQVNHIDGNKQNNYVDNLEWCTRSENMLHAYSLQLQPHNHNTYSGKFTQSDRDKIKRLWDSGELSKREIAEKHNVSHTCICDIISDKYKYANTVNLFKEVAKPLVDMLNELRDSYLSCEDSTIKKQIWYNIIQLLPSSYNQKRTVMLNYQVLKNMYHARKNHKLTEWVCFCDEIKRLPYMEDFINEMVRLQQ